MLESVRTKTRLYVPRIVGWPNSCGFRWKAMFGRKNNQATVMIYLWNREGRRQFSRKREMTEVLESEWWSGLPDTVSKACTSLCHADGAGVLTVVVACVIAGMCVTEKSHTSIALEIIASSWPAIADPMLCHRPCDSPDSPPFPTPVLPFAAPGLVQRLQLIHIGPLPPKIAPFFLASSCPYRTASVAELLRFVWHFHFSSTVGTV
ncbi:hypothetical protein J6590_082491 [Homalodisca vitripennis]|nr:hypothetical protein J6590_082491 [Homalodisca vitripennis]